MTLCVLRLECESLKVNGRIGVNLGVFETSSSAERALAGMIPDGCTICHDGNRMTIRKRSQGMDVPVSVGDLVKWGVVDYEDLDPLAHEPVFIMECYDMGVLGRKC